MFGTTDNLNEHLKYSINEWNNSEYYKKVQLYLKENKIKNFIDVGSCSGGVSDVFFNNLPSLEKGILIEAIPENYEYIKNRIGPSEKILFINKALFYNHSHITLGSVRTNVGGWSYQSKSNTIKLETTTLENVIDENKIFLNGGVNFIKIDIEGAEYNIIENSEILKETPFIEIEFHVNDEYNINYSDSKFLSDSWEPFVKKHLPNHTLIHGGKTEKVTWPNGQDVIYDGSGFFVLTRLLK